MSIIFKSKIPPWAVVYPEIKNIIANPAETPFCVGIPYGLQLQKEIWNHEPLRVVRSVNTTTGHSFISHHGVGKKNQINIWNFSKETQAGNFFNGFQSIPTDLKFQHILFAQRRWVYVMYCTDLSLRVFSAKFHAISTTVVNKTVLSLAYNEIRDEILTGIAGGIMTWRFPIGQTDPLIPGQLISCSFTQFDWVMSIILDNITKQILAISELAISMIDIATHKERCFFQKKCDYSFTTCVFYSPASFFITGDKNGSIRAWSTSLNSFPLVTQFLGHTAEITKLLVHPKEPLLVSSSLDETIRVWNFDTSALTFKLETGEKIMEMELLSGDLLFYHSDHHMKIWSLNLFHSLFTVLSSRIKRWSRVKSPGYTSRVLVLAEDGGVRLVSPVHGYELTTMLPITTMTADIVDVAHDPRQEKIYLVLSTSEVLVFESDTNPCCVYQLWVAESPDEGVCTLAMINSEFALHKNEIPLKSGLLFAGHYNGQISLLSGKDVYMKENVQAHHGQVTFLRISSSFAGSHDSLAAHDHLVSCGTDLTVRIWQIIHPELNRVLIQQKALVKLLQSPTDLTMAGNTLCMAMADNNVVMCRVRAQEKRGGANIFNRDKETYEFLTHSKDERHTAPINGLSCCSTLGIFATSSEDHSVKLWNCDNQLVREMNFDESLCGVCFANSRGDILVGFQSHISLVTIINYLPLPYLEILSKMNFENDPFEDLVPFDDLLKFWYDPDRVPRMPLSASKRRQLEALEVMKPKKRKKKEAVIFKQKTEEEEEMDLFQKRRRSRRLSTQVHVMMALRRLSQYTSSSKTRILKAVKCMKEVVTGEPMTKTEPPVEEATPTLPGAQETAKVYWPCAPDGYIPNSVIRMRVKPRKLPGRLIPRMTRPKPKKKYVKEEEEEDEESMNRIKDFWALFQLMQASLVRETMEEKASKKKGKKEGWKKRKVVSKLGQKLAPRSLAEKSEEMDHEESEEQEEVEEIEEKVEEKPKQEVSEQLVEEGKEERSPESSHGGSGSQLVETPKEMSDESEEEKHVYISDIDEFQSSPSEGRSTTSDMKITSPDLSLLTRIVRKKWYPILEQRRRMIPEVDDVIDNMLDVIKNMNNSKTIQDIVEQFMNVDREFGIPEDKKVVFQNQLIKLSYNEDARKRQTAVWALGEMGVHREDAYLTVVRRLVDSDKDTREEAKRVLKKLTGVDTMEGLTELITKLGVVHLHLPCNDNAVLMELAVRLRQHKKKQETLSELSKEDSEKSTPLDNLRTTLRRKPFKAKFKHPKTMDRRLMGTGRPRRRPSILDEPASLVNTEKLKDTLKKSKLGCKLLQQMGPIKDGIIPRHSLPSGGNIVEPKSIQFGGERKEEKKEKQGASLSPIQQVQEDEKSMQLNARTLMEGRFILSEQFSHEASPVTPTTLIASGTPKILSPAYQTRLAIYGHGGTILSLEIPESKTKRDDVDIKAHDKQKSQKARESPRAEIVKKPKDAQWKNIDRLKALEGHSSELLSLAQILQIMDGITGINQRKLMLQLLKMKRTGRITPQNITLEDKAIQQFYTVADLLELICQLSPLDGVLKNLAQKMSISKEEILMKMRGLFRSECPITIERGDYFIINGLGRLPLKYQETLLRRRKGLLQKIGGYVRHMASPTSGESEVTGTFHSQLEGILLLCAMLEPEMEMEEFSSVASSVASLERLCDRKRRTQYISTRKEKGDEMPPIFVQPSLHYSLCPGTHGQRLLNSTLIRARALSDSRLQSSRKTNDFVVTALPHRLSVHTGTKIEGESHFGILELTWRAGTPLKQINEETPHNANTSNFPQLSGKPVEPMEPLMLDNHEKKHCQSKIPKLQSVAPLSHRKVKPFAEKKLNLFRAVNSLNEQDSLEALRKYIINQTIIKRNLLPRGSFTNHPPSPDTTNPTPFRASSPLPSLNNDSVTSVGSGDSSERCLQFCESSPDMTGDTLLRELNKYHLPPISKVGGQNRSP